jgi:hypothetical protein
MSLNENKVDRMNEWPFQDVSQSRWNRLSERQKGFVEESFRREIEAIEMRAVNGRRHDFRVIQGGKSERPPVTRMGGSL